tara:strand:+ start:2772 stop:3020 length:249 start_codon:yes stop_codon:yes gene_type:complete
MITKINIYSVFLLFILIFIYYIIYKYIEYLYKKNDKISDVIIKEYRYYNDIIKKMIILITIISFIYEIYDKKNVIKYIFNEN